MAESGKYVSLVISVVALGISGVSVWATLTNLARTRETLLLEQRATACAALEGAAERITSAYRAASGIPATTSNEERYRLSQIVSASVSDLRGAQMLALLGPEDLAQAEQDLIAAAKRVSDITGGFSAGPAYNAEAVDARLQAAWADTAAHDSAMRDFFSARTGLLNTCRTTLGVYRVSAPTE